MGPWKAIWAVRWEIWDDQRINNTSIELHSFHFSSQTEFQSKWEQMTSCALPRWRQVPKGAFENGSFQCISLVCYFCILILYFVADSDFSCCSEMMLWLYQHLLDPNFNVIQMGGEQGGKGEGHFLLYWPSLVFAGRSQCSNADLSHNFMEGPCGSVTVGSKFLFSSPCLFLQLSIHGENPGRWGLCRAAVTLLMDSGDEPHVPGTAEPCLPPAHPHQHQPLLGGRTYLARRHVSYWGHQ